MATEAVPGKSPSREQPHRIIKRPPVPPKPMAPPTQLKGILKTRQESKDSPTTKPPAPPPKSKTSPQNSKKPLPLPRPKSFDSSHMQDTPPAAPPRSVSLENGVDTYPSQPIQEKEHSSKVPVKPTRSVSFKDDTTANLSPLQPREPGVSVSHSEGFPLTDLFTEEYCNKLPLCIIILEGYRGTIPELCMSTSDVYNIHFMKHRSVVCIRDSMGQLYSVPLNSSVKFGLVYNPEGRATAYATFPTVADVLAEKTVLPKIVCATQTFDGASDKLSVQKNEVLVILKARRSKMRRKGLEVYSLLTNTNKVLAGDCKGHFTTDPAKTCLHLPMIVEHVRDPFPSKVILFPSKQSTYSAQDISESFFTGSVTMLYAKKETSLVATAVIDEPLSERSPLLDFPHDDCLSEVEVAIIPVDDNESLHCNTQSLYENFDISKLKSWKDTGSRNTYITQEFFYTSYQEGYEKYGVELEVSSASHNQYAEVKNKETNKVAISDSGDSDDYEEVDESDSSTYEEIIPPSHPNNRSLVSPPQIPPSNPNNRSLIPPPQIPPSNPNNRSLIPPPQMPPSYPNNRTLVSPPQMPPSYHNNRSLVPPPQKSPIRSTRSLPAPLSRAPIAISSDDDGEYDLPDTTRRQVGLPQAPGLPNSTHPTHKALSRTQSASARYYDYATSLRDDDTQRSAILAELKELRSDISQLSSRVERLEKQSEMSQEKRNRNHLQTLTPEQVQALLDKMGLSQYKDVFAREQITGEVLSELSEEDLQHELGVKSRIHRIRLMKVISG